MAELISKDIQLDSLKNEYIIILKLYNNIIIKKTEIENKINGIKEIYNELVKKNPEKPFLFCLDSLFFQYKILNLDLEHYNKKIALIQNRIYGDYYKLYNMIGNYASNEHIKEPIDKFPIYKDIDPFYKYKLDDISAIHAQILYYLGELYNTYNKKTENIKYHRDNIAVGISLIVFIHTLEHERDTLRNQILLFINYITFYHKTQIRYLEYIYRSITEFYANLEETILLCMGNNNGYIESENDLYMENIYFDILNMAPDTYNYPSVIDISNTTIMETFENNKESDKPPENDNDNNYKLVTNIDNIIMDASSDISFDVSSNKLPSRIIRSNNTTDSENISEDINNCVVSETCHIDIEDTEPYNNITMEII